MKGHPEAAVKTASAMIVGLPNSGKTSLYNELTGDYALVANYPLTTVETRRKECEIDGRKWGIVDTPGLHGLFIQSEEEAAVRELLFSDPPDVLIQCVDANRLAQSLTLTADLVELGVPMALCVTAIGESERMGKRIDTAGLEKALGVPVIASARPGAGGEPMKAALRRAAVPSSTPGYGKSLEAAVDGIAADLPAGEPFPRKEALLLIEGDRILQNRLRRTAGEEAARRIGEAVRAQCASLAGAASLLVAEPKNRWVEGMAGRTAVAVARREGRMAERLAAVCRHPVLGLPVLALFLALLYVAVVYVAGFLSSFLTRTVTEPLVILTARLMPDGFWEDLLLGPYGLLTLGLFNAVGTVLPVLSVFFLVFGLLEDVGYLPNLTILTKRVLSKVGITGNSIIPLVLGFGCKTMATLTVRSVSSRKEKLIVVFLIAFAIPCSAQMGLNIAILGRHGPMHFLVTIVALVFAELAAGFVLNAILPAEPPSAYIQELPPLRMPDPMALLAKTGHRMVWFLKEAIPIFLAASVILFALDKAGALRGLKVLLTPLMTGWLGLPVDMVDALILSMARHEAAAGMILRMSDAGFLDGVQSIVAVSITTMFVPCVANIAAMFKEIGWKAGLAVALSINASAFALAGGLNALLRLLQGVLGL